jgi:hypothetical protein
MTSLSFKRGNTTTNIGLGTVIAENNGMTAKISSLSLPTMSSEDTLNFNFLGKARTVGVTGVIVGDSNMRTFIDEMEGWVNVSADFSIPSGIYGSVFSVFKNVLPTVFRRERSVMTPNVMEYDIKLVEGVNLFDFLSHAETYSARTRVSPVGPKISTITSLGNVIREIVILETGVKSMPLVISSSAGNLLTSIFGKKRIIILEGVFGGTISEMGSFVSEIDGWVNAGVQTRRTYTDSFGHEFSVLADEWRWDFDDAVPTQIEYSLSMLEGGLGTGSEEDLSNPETS